ncbi:MAG: SAM-dependent methyltransferase [Candidatus Altiarchaeota archaeon]|nr:SAM-dependent methyltransferase [Candidatus Altiarchaeota archaeon]
MIRIAYKKERYRRLLADMVDEGDTVIEVGPHLGKSTRGYVNRAEKVFAVDKSPQAKEAMNELQRECPNLVFVEGDVRSFETVEALMKETGECDLLAVDMGGGRYPDTVFKVWATLSGVFEPKKSLIRNRGLAEFVQRAEVADKSVIKDFHVNGWLSEYGRGIPYKLKKQLDEFRFWVDITEKLD